MWAFLAFSYPFADISQKELLRCIVNSHLIIFPDNAELSVIQSCNFDHGVRATLFTSTESYSTIIRDFSTGETKFHFPLSLSENLYFIELRLEDVGRYAVAAISSIMYANASWGDCLEITGITTVGKLCILYNTCIEVTVLQFRVDIYFGEKLSISLDNNNGSACYDYTEELMSTLSNSPLYYYFFLTGSISELQNDVFMRCTLELSDIASTTLGNLKIVQHDEIVIAMLQPEQSVIDRLENFVVTLKLVSVNENEIGTLGVREVVLTPEMTIYFDGTPSSDQLFAQITASINGNLEILLSESATTVNLCWNAAIIIHDDRAIAKIVERDNVTGCIPLQMAEYVTLHGKNGKLMVQSSIKPDGNDIELPALHGSKYNDHEWILMELWSNSSLMTAIVVSDFSVAGYKRYIVICSSTLAAVAFLGIAINIVYFVRTWMKLMHEES